MVMTGLVGLGMRHAYDSPAGKRGDDVIDKIRLDMLDGLGTMNEIDPCDKWTLAQIVNTDRVHRALQVSGEPIDGSHDTVMLLVEICRRVTLSAADIEDRTNRKPINQIVPDGGGMGIRIAMINVAAEAEVAVVVNPA